MHECMVRTGVREEKLHDRRVHYCFSKRKGLEKILTGTKENIITSEKIKVEEYGQYV